jgi:predicted transposase/invertase (TIGR01784 family)
LQESYISEELKEYFSDLIFEVKVIGNVKKETDIVMLFEHKSSPDKYVTIQIGHYMFSHLFKCIRTKKALKPIIPLIYYQGEAKWKVPTVAELFKDIPTSVKEYLPQLKHIFFALNSIPNDVIEKIKNGMMASAISAQKLRFNPTKLTSDIARIFALFPEKDYDGNFLLKLSVYILNVSDVSEDQLAESLKFIPQELKENIMTTYTRLIQKGEQIGIQKGEQIGIQKGEQIGIQKEKIKVVLNGFDNDLKIPVISNITNLSEADVMTILKNYGRI